MANGKLLTADAFDDRLPELRKRLATALKRELQDCALPDPGTDLWDLPPVDSKTVVKLSPIVSEMIGHRLRPSWIRKGGYDSINDAIEDLLTHIRANCVVGSNAKKIRSPVAVRVPA